MVALEAFVVLAKNIALNQANPLILSIVAFNQEKLNYHWNESSNF